MEENKPAIPLRLSNSRGYVFNRQEEQAYNRGVADGIKKGWRKGFSNGMAAGACLCALALFAGITYGKSCFSNKTEPQAPPPAASTLEETADTADAEQAGIKFNPLGYDYVETVRPDGKILLNSNAYGARPEDIFDAEYIDLIIDQTLDDKTLGDKRMQMKIGLIREKDGRYRIEDTDKVFGFLPDKTYDANGLTAKVNSITAEIVPYPVEEEACEH